MSKKSEILHGSFSSIKYAAFSMAKKIDEIKEAISNNSTPVKSGSAEYNQTLSEIDSKESSEVDKARRISEDFDLWSRLSDSRKSSFANLISLNSNAPSVNISYPIFSENLYPEDNEVMLIKYFYKYIIFHVVIFI